MIFYAFISSITLNLIVIVLLSYLWYKQHRISSHINTIGQQAAKGELPIIINKSYNQINELATEIEQLNQYYSKLYRLTDNTLQNIGLVRYNAFNEMGGNLSFSLALLNNQNDGLIMTSINGRNDHRLYIKQINAGLSPDFPLSDEEANALEQAQKSARAAVKNVQKTKFVKKVKKKQKEVKTS